MIITTRVERPRNPEPGRVFGVYRVCGRRVYRGHQPGTVFHAVLDPAAEQRAVARGDIELLDRLEPDLQPGSWTLPRHWPPRGAGTATREAPTGASLTGEER